jgi:hypothetical protein
MEKIIKKVLSINSKKEMINYISTNIKTILEKSFCISWNEKKTLVLKLEKNIDGLNKQSKINKDIDNEVVNLKLLVFYSFLIKIAYLLNYKNDSLLEYISLIEEIEIDEENDISLILKNYIFIKHKNTFEDEIEEIEIENEMKNKQEIIEKNEEINIKNKELQKIRIKIYLSIIKGFKRSLSFDKELEEIFCVYIEDSFNVFYPEIQLLSALLYLDKENDKSYYSEINYFCKTSKYEEIVRSYSGVKILFDKSELIINQNNKLKQ